MTNISQKKDLKKSQAQLREIQIFCCFSGNMKISLIVTTFLAAVTSVEASMKICQTNGFAGCECNFVGGCDLNGDPTVSVNQNYEVLKDIAPQNIEQFAYAKPLYNLGKLCEGGTIAILYDCNARIPLYAATEIKTGNVGRKGKKFHASSVAALEEFFQAKLSDYIGLEQEVVYYEHKNGYFSPWNIYSGTGTVPLNKGHMIPACYASSDGKRMYNTFSLTNVVPQFQTFNAGAWADAERYIVEEWGANCQNKANIAQSVRVFIVVGAIPSTYIKQPKFYGASGLSDFEGPSNLKNGGDYRIVVPDVMWTAACCTLPDQHNTVIDVMAFAGYNKPNKNSVDDFDSPQAMFKFFTENLYAGMKDINLFPKSPKCMTGPN